MSNLCSTWGPNMKQAFGLFPTLMRFSPYQTLAPTIVKWSLGLLLACGCYLRSVYIVTPIFFRQATSNRQYLLIFLLKESVVQIMSHQILKPNGQPFIHVPLEHIIHFSHIDYDLFIRAGRPLHNDRDQHFLQCVAQLNVFNVPCNNQCYSMECVQYRWGLR